MLKTPYYEAFVLRTGRQEGGCKPFCRAMFQWGPWPELRRKQDNGIRVLEAKFLVVMGSGPSTVL